MQDPENTGSGETDRCWSRSRPGDASATRAAAWFPREIGHCAIIFGIHDGAVIFQEMQLWVDEVARAGPETMAVDEWLLETIACPVLRVYSWKGDWGSLGYFGEIAKARESFPDLDLVRRWTGGGMVDHRCDWTYTLVVPKGEFLARLRGAESYRLIHEQLMQTIAQEKIAAKMSWGESMTGANVCFENPVTYDLVDSDGRKLAGAGQRRSRSGLLHQGSVAGVCINPVESKQRSEAFASQLSRSWSEFCDRPDSKVLSMKIGGRYNRLEWLNRR